MWCSSLLPKEIGRKYNLQSKQLIKLFSKILVQDEEDMLQSLDQGDVAETIREFFESSISVRPNTQSVLTLQEVKKIINKLKNYR